MPSPSQNSLKLAVFKGLLALLLPLSATAATAAERLFYYNIPGYPPIGDCHTVAKTLAKQFTLATGVATATSRCVDITSSRFTFEISYLAEEPLQLISTDHDAMGGNGVFAKLENCQQALVAEAQHFTDVTGLKAATAYCRRLPGETARPFVPRVDGFGTPDVRPWVSHMVLIDPPVGISVENLEKEIERNFRARQVDVRYARVSSGFYGDTYVRYYAEERMHIDADEMARVRTREQCAEQLAIARTIPHTQTSAPVALYCASGIASYYVKGIYQDLPWGTSFVSAERFNSYADCHRDRAALVAAYNSRMDNTVAGGLCTEDSDDFGNNRAIRVIMFNR